MGLAERKAAKQFEETLYPKLQKDVEAAARFEVPVQVDWASLTAEGYAELYAEAWPQVYFAPLIGALDALGQDDLGRDFLRGALKRIVIRNSSSNSSASSIATFQEGVLTLDHEPVTNLDQVDDRKEAIRKTLEAAPELPNPYTGDPLRSFLEADAKGVDALLHALVRITARERAGVPLFLPRATLSLRSGRAITGVVREMLEDRREGRSILVFAPREGGYSQEDASIIPVGTVEAVTVHDVVWFGELRRDSVPVPSLLDLRRQLIALEARLRAVTEAPLEVMLAPGVNPASAEELRALGFLAERVREVVESLAKDEIGRTALREKVKRIQLRTDAQASVSVSNGTLDLVSGLRPVSWQTHQELEQALQKAL
ncbi:hypothetical protein ACN469_30025 [Corallococcus terminator]